MNSESLLNAIFSSDVEAASEALNGALASKVANALEVKKVEIASNLISAPTEMSSAEVATETVDATE
jgi:hypothetical protein